MTPCVSTRTQKPLLLLTRLERWLAQQAREALDAKKDAEAAELSNARIEVCRLICALVQSEQYGGPVSPLTRQFMPGIELLSRVEDRLTQQLATARAGGSSESVELHAARRTVRGLLSEAFESWRQAREELVQRGKELG
jgi:hypothetical protein